MKRVWLLLAMFFVAAIFQPLFVYAMDVRPLDQAQVPSGIAPRGDTGNQLAFTGNGLTFNIINRAVIEVEVDNSSDQVWTGVETSSSTIANVVGGRLIRSHHHRDRSPSRDLTHYVLDNSTDGYGSKGYTRYTAIRDVNALTTSSADLSERWRSLSDQDIVDSFDGSWAQIISTYERIPDPVRDGCQLTVHGRGDLHPGLGLTNATDDTPELPVAWACNADRIFEITNALNNLENYNVTHEANDDGTTLAIVFPENDASRDSFVYCDDNQYALESCENPRGNWIIDGHNPDDFMKDSNVPVTVTNGSQSFPMSVAGNESESSTHIGGGGSSDPDQDSCESAGNLSWILCGLVHMTGGALNWVSGQVETLLDVPEERYRHEGIQQSWTLVRNLAYILLIPAMLIMVISTALGFDFVSSYTVKSALPRMVAATILIALSWELTGFMIAVVHAIGQGIAGLILYPFPDAATELSNIVSITTGGALTVGVIAAVAVAGGLSIILSFLGSALLIIFMVFMFLVAREMMILALIIVAPLAIIAWIFPGLNKLWSTWWGYFYKLLFIYPVIMAMLAMGLVFAHMLDDAQTTGGAAGEAQNALIPLFQIAAVVIPFALIPLAFKQAGGAMGSLASAVDQRRQGVEGRLKKQRGAKAAENFAKTQNFSRFKGANRISRGANSLLGYTSNAGKAGVNPRKWKRKLSTVASDASIAQHEAMLKDEGYEPWKGNDGLNKAASSTNNARELRKALIASGDYKGPNAAANLNRDVERVEAMRQKYGNTALKQAAWVQAISGGTAFKGTTDAWEAAGKIANGDDAVLAKLVAQGRSAAMGAGRIDQGGAGFMDTMKVAQSYYEDPGYRPEDADATHAANVIKSQGPGSLAHASMKPTAIKNLAPAFQKRIEGATKQGDRETAQALASAAGSLTLARRRAY
ncbi:MAG: hypothetical protein U5K77_01760 [Candidatus Saccharibacteria bacterium]|nr:hypothetical protein [Candidatus Saccharibacteria bacterium]